MSSPTRSHRTLPRLAGMLLAAVFLAPAPARADEVGPTPVAPSATPFEARLEALRRRVVEDAADPAVAADLYELEDTLRYGGSLERGADALRAVARNRRALPEVRALAWRLLADVERLRGRLPRMDEALDAIGVLRDFAFVGPFDDENEEGYDVAWGPELDLDLARAHDGLRGEVSWRRVEGLGRTGTVAFHEAVRPASEVVIYALATLTVPDATVATLYLGTPGGTKAWLNGEPILADPAYHPARFDQTSVQLRLRRGENVLLLKLAAGTAGPLELHARVVGPDGKPIRGLRVAAPVDGRFPAPKPIPPGTTIRGRRPLVDGLERAARAGDPRAQWALARVLAERRPFDVDEKLHEAAAARAADAAPGRIEAQLLAASTADDANEARTFLERAAALDAPGEARGHAALARFWRGRGDGHRALRLLLEPAARAPDDWPSQLLLAELLDQAGWEAQAAQRVEVLADRFPDEPRILEALARYRLRERRADEAARLYRVVLGHRPAARDAAASLASILVERGAVEEADRVLANAQRLSAPDVDLLLRRADLLAANGRAKEADALYAEAMALAPQESEVFERAGQSALRRGDVEAAIPLFERALAARPQDARLKELVLGLRPDGRSFAAPFLHDLREAAARAKAHEGEDAVKLVDLQATRVLPSGQASRTRQTIVRVQTRRGVDRFRAMPIRYAPDREQVRVERARVLKPDGTIVDAHEERERAENEAWSGMYFDTRTRVVAFPALAPGDVVELVWRVDDVGRDNLLGDYFGDVEFLEDTVPTERWEYVLEMPAGRRIHFNEVPIATYAAEPVDGGGTLHRWTAQDLDRLHPEPRMPGWSEVATYLHVSTYADWDAVGRFWWGLIRDQIQPTPTIERLAREIVAEIPADDIEARVRAVYGWVVENTRYVGLEFGIHSFKPYKVDQVVRRGFGDCKDKASLIWSMLKVLGIDSKMVLLRMRHLGAIGERPASLAIFNHAIVYVPALDLWLDGTAEWSGASELPVSDRGAEVLVVDPEGGSVFRTIPEAPASLSVTASRQTISLAADGSANLGGESRIRGLPAPGYRRAYASPNARRATFEQAWARTWPGVTVTRLEMSDPARIEEEVRMDFGLRIPGYADRVGEDALAFRPLGRARTWVESYAPTSSRRLPLVLDHAFENRFDTTWELPEGFEVERLPEGGEVRSRFGAASLRIEAGEDGAVHATAHVAIEVARVEPGDYPAFRAFLGEVDALFGGRVVVRRTSAEPAPAGL